MYVQMYLFFSVKSKLIFKLVYFFTLYDRIEF